MSQNAKTKTGACDRSRTQCKIDISALSPSAIGALLVRTVKAGDDVSAILWDIADTKDLRISNASENLKAVVAAAKHRPLTAGFDPSSFPDQSQLRERREYLIDAMYDDHAFQQARRRRKKTIRDVRN